MANPILQTVFGPPDPNASPLNIVELVNLLNQLVTTTFQSGVFQPYIISAETPGVDQRNLVWIQIDSASRPIAIKTWVPGAGGAWRRVYNGMLGEIRIYSGDPSIDFPTASRGVVGGTYDGWALCDGNNGTTDLSDQFVIPAHMNNLNHPGYVNGQWLSYVQPGLPGQNAGGNATITLDQAHTYQVGLEISPWSADGNAANNNGNLFGVPAPGQAVVRELIPPNLNPGAINTVPPFIAMGYIQFIGY